MKNLSIFILLLIVTPVVGAETMQYQQTIDYNGRNITLVGAQESKVLISIDGEKNIFQLNQQKEVAGVKVLVTEIFYAGDLSTATVSLALSYSCGDKICDENYESSGNCCNDCGCSNNLKCIENACIVPECSKNTDCNDNSPLTDDSCSDFKCKFKNIKCEYNSDCNDDNSETEDICDKGRCKNFLGYICKVNEDCEDDNPCTIDECINQDCKNTIKENCELEEKEEVKGLDKKENLEEKVIKIRKNILSRFIEWIKNLF